MIILLSSFSLIFSIYCVINYQELETSFSYEDINILFVLQALFPYYLLFFVFRFDINHVFYVFASIISLFLILKDSLIFIHDEYQNILLGIFSLNTIGYLLITLILFLHKGKIPQKINKKPIKYDTSSIYHSKRHHGVREITSFNSKFFKSQYS